MASEPWQFLLMLNSRLLMPGIFIELLPAMLLTAPLFLPMAQAMQIDLILMGVIMVMNLSIALYECLRSAALCSLWRSCAASIGGMSRHIIRLRGDEHHCAVPHDLWFLVVEGAAEAARVS